ncbi:MAG: DUF4864 domain-containing protein [Myxococcota bacterium]
MVQFSLLMLAALNFDQQPTPALSAVEVVQLQLDALQASPETPNHAGIRLAFRFASPSNRAVTGPVNRFIPMVKSEAYAPLLGFDRASLAVIEETSDQAKFLVELQRGTRLYHYLWEVSRQATEPYQGCWMTDAVVPVEAGGPEQADTIEA